MVLLNLYPEPLAYRALWRLDNLRRYPGRNERRALRVKARLAMLPPEDAAKLLQSEQERYQVPRVRRPAQRKTQEQRDRHAEARFMRVYGLSSGEYNSRLQEQGGVCAICRLPETATQRGVPCRLTVDHDHATGKVRALLCGKCNSVLGYAKDETAHLEAAIAYLRKHTGDV